MEIPKIQPKQLPDLTPDIDIQRPGESDAQPVGFAQNDSAVQNAVNFFDDVLTGATAGTEASGTQDLPGEQQNMADASKKIQDGVEQETPGTPGIHTPSSAFGGDARSIYTTRMQGLQDFLSALGFELPSGGGTQTSSSTSGGGSGAPAGGSGGIGGGNSGAPSLQDVMDNVGKLPEDELTNLAGAFGIDLPGGNSVSDFRSLIGVELQKAGTNGKRDEMGYGKAAIMDGAAGETETTEVDGEPVDDTEADTEEGDPIDDASTDEDTIQVDEFLEEKVALTELAFVVAVAITIAIQPETAPLLAGALLDPIPPGDSDYQMGHQPGSKSEYWANLLHVPGYGSGNTDGGDPSPIDNDIIGGSFTNVVTSQGEYGMLGNPGTSGGLADSGGGNFSIGKGDDNPNDTFEQRDQDRVADTLNRHTLKPKA